MFYLIRCTLLHAHGMVAVCQQSEKGATLCCVWKSTARLAILLNGVVRLDNILQPFNPLFVHIKHQKISTHLLLLPFPLTLLVRDVQHHGVAMLFFRQLTPLV